MMSKNEKFETSFTNPEYKGLHEEIMRVALGYAEAGLNAKEVPVGCVFVRFSESLGHEVVFGSHNLTSCNENGVDHCEIACLKEMNKRGWSPEGLRQLWLYVTVEPCIMCGYALNLSGIDFFPVSHNVQKRSQGSHFRVQK